MQNYLELMQRIRDTGLSRADRTGTGTVGLFGERLEFRNTYDAFPLVTTKRIHLKSVIHELLWFLRGDTNIAYLNEHGVRIWDEWADEKGDLGPIYGEQWRSWRGASGRTTDQIAWLIDELRKNPWSRRLVISAWNVDDLDRMALNPCHPLFQFYVRPMTLDERIAYHEQTDNTRMVGIRAGMEAVLNAQHVPKLWLDLAMYQRSADYMLGAPFNIASYCLLQHLVARTTGMVPGHYYQFYGDVHLYNDHIREGQVNTQLARVPLPPPQCRIRTARERLEDYVYEDIEILDYVSHPAIKATVSV